MPDTRHPDAAKAVEAVLDNIDGRSGMDLGQIDEEIVDEMKDAFARIIQDTAMAGAIEDGEAWRDVARGLASALSCLEWHHDDPDPYCASCNTHSKTMQHRKGCHVGEALSKYRAVSKAYAALAPGAEGVKDAT